MDNKMRYFKTIKVKNKKNKIKKILTNIFYPIFSSRIAMIGLIIVFFWIFVGLFAPFLTRYSPTEQDWKLANQGPSYIHLLGTDELGRDLWSRVIYGARIVLVIMPISDHFFLPGGTAIWGVLVAVTIGIFLGLISGYKGGFVDEIVMRILDAMISIPVILLYLLILVAIGTSVVNIVIAIAIVGIPAIARMVRSLTLDIRTREYVKAAETRGENNFYIMFVEILPNTIGPVIVDAMLRIGYAIYAMGTLGFLGLGIPPPSPDWGSMIAEGREFIFTNPWIVLWPSVAISSLVIGLNFLADGFQEERNRFM